MVSWGLMHLGEGAQVGAGVSLIYLGEIYLYFLPCGKPGGRKQYCNKIIFKDHHSVKRPQGCEGKMGGGVGGRAGVQLATLVPSSPPSGGKYLA